MVEKQERSNLLKKAKLTRGSVRYSILFGAMFGLATGGLSDLHKMASNQSPSYVDYLKKKVAQ
jgi:hypothetical protein